MPVPLVPALRGSSPENHPAAQQQQQQQRNTSFSIVKILHDVGNSTAGADDYSDDADAADDAVHTPILANAIATAARMLDASVAALRTCDAATSDQVAAVFYTEDAEDDAAAACASLARNLTRLRRGCLDHLRLVLDLRAPAAGSEEANTIAYVRRYELVVRAAPVVIPRKTFFSDRRTRCIATAAARMLIRA